MPKAEAPEMHGRNVFLVCGNGRFIGKEADEHSTHNVPNIWNMHVCATCNTHIIEMCMVYSST